MLLEFIDGYFDDYGVAFRDGRREFVKEKSFGWDVFLLDFCIFNELKIYVINIILIIRIILYVKSKNIKLIEFFML